MTNDELSKLLAASVRDYVYYFGADQNSDGGWQLRGREGKLEEWILDELNEHVDDDY